MIPTEGTINIIGNSGTLTATTIANILTGTVTAGSTLMIVTTAPTNYENLNSTSGVFLTSTATSTFAACTRVIAQRSPISYAISNVAYNSGTTTVTLTVNTLPFAPATGGLIYIENSTNSALNGTYTLIGSPTVTSLQFTLATNPGTGFTGGIVFPGINTSTLVGYYTINRAAIGSVTANTLVNANIARNPFVVPTGTTHVIPTSGTANFANILIDGIGSVSIPCNQLLSLKNLKGGSCFMASGTVSGTDVLSLSYCTRSWP